MADQYIRLAGGYPPVDTLAIRAGDDPHWARVCNNCQGRCCGLGAEFTADDNKERLAAFELVNWFISTVSGSYWRAMQEATEIYVGGNGGTLRTAIARMKEGDTTDAYRD